MHVWRIPLDLPGRLVADLLPLLSDQENDKAKQLLREEARRQFVISHGATRSILGRYLDQGPQEIRFVTGGRGKPHVVASAGAPALCFSLSHSGQVALCAVTEGREVGVDVEQVRPVSAWRHIAASYFSVDENRALGSVGDDEAREAFFRIWTRKEAYSKALGEGVSQRWRQFTVSLQPRAAAVMADVAVGAGPEGTFTIFPLAPGPGYVAALAVRGAGPRLSCWQWSTNNL